MNIQELLNLCLPQVCIRIVEDYYTTGRGPENTTQTLLGIYLPQSPVQIVQDYYDSGCWHKSCLNLMACRLVFVYPQEQHISMLKEPAKLEWFLRRCWWRDIGCEELKGLLLVASRRGVNDCVSLIIRHISWRYRIKWARRCWAEAPKFSRTREILAPFTEV